MENYTLEQIQRFKEYERQRLKIWYQENKEKKLAYCKQYYDTNLKSTRIKKTREEKREINRERCRRFREKKKQDNELMELLTEKTSTNIANIILSFI